DSTGLGLTREVRMRPTPAGHGRTANRSERRFPSAGSRRAGGTPELPSGEPPASAPSCGGNRERVSHRGEWRTGLKKRRLVPPPRPADRASVRGCPLLLHSAG